jgi:hypothetical protein
MGFKGFDRMRKAMDKVRIYKKNPNETVEVEIKRNQ